MGDFKFSRNVLLKNEIFLEGNHYLIFQSQCVATRFGLLNSNLDEPRFFKTSSSFQHLLYTMYIQ
jgi:hypothetical protein